MAEEIRRVEDQDREQDHRDANAERILHRVVRMERDLVLRALYVDAERVVRTRNVQRPDMQDNHAQDQEGQQIVQGEEAIESRLSDREAAPEPLHDRRADARDHHVNRGEQVGDNLRGPVAHLTPGQHIAHEAGGHHQEIDDQAEEPQHLTRMLVGAVIEAAENVDIDDEEEHGGAIRMRIAKQPAIIHVAHNMLDAVERHAGFRRIVHREHDTGHDLDDQEETGKHAEIPPVVQILRARIAGANRAINQGEDRQLLVEPLNQLVFRLEACCGHLWAPLTDTNVGVVDERVWNQRQIRRSRSLTDAAGRIVDRPMAGAEKAPIGALISYRYAAKMRANGGDDEPFRLHDAIFVGLGITKVSHIDVFGLLDFLRCPVTHEDRISAPENRDALAGRDRAQIDLGR